jgi:hypothetical protein
MSELLRFDGQAVRVLVSGKHVDLNLWDEQPDAEYLEPRRRLSPTVVHIILLSFAIDSPDSLESVKEKVDHVSYCLASDHSYYVVSRRGFI